MVFFYSRKDAALSADSLTIRVAESRFYSLIAFRY